MRLVPPPLKAGTAGHTDQPRPHHNSARVHQQRPRPPTSLRSQPTSSRCPATAAIAIPDPTPRRSPCARTRRTTSAHAPAPNAPARHRTTRTPPGPPPPPVPTTPPHPPTPTPPPKATPPPRDSSDSARPTRSSGSCESGPGQSPPSRAWSTGPARGQWRTAASSRRGGGCHRPHGKPCWPMRSGPGSPPPQPPRAPGPPVCPQAPAEDTPGDAKRRQAPVGHHPKPDPAHTHPLTTPQASTHRHRQHPKQPGSPARHTAQRT